MTRTPFTGKNSFIENNAALKTHSSQENTYTPIGSRLQSIIELSPAGMLIIDGETGSILTANEAFEAISGYQRDELFEQPFQYLLPPEEIFQVFKDFQLFVQTGKQQRLHYNLSTKKGSAIHAKVRSTLEEIEGKPLVFIAFIEIKASADASQNLRYPSSKIGTSRWTVGRRETLDEDSAVNNSVLDSTPFSYLLLDHKTVVRSFNKTASLSISRFKGSKLNKGEPFIKYVPEKYHAEFKQAFQLALSGKFQKKEMELWHPEEGLLWISITLAPAYGEDAEVAGISAIVEDITKNKNAENLIIRQNRELKKANRELDKFVYSVSHDLRSPIANVMGLATIIEDCETIEEVKEFSAMINSTMQRMDQFIHNILDYSRNNRLEIMDNEVSINELVEEVVQDYQHIDAVKNIQVTVCVDSDLTLKTDRQRLSIILNNLVSNAVKYHDPAKKRRFVRITAKMEDGFLFIRVCDNGQGIEEKHMPNLFKMFYTANLRAQGSGIGLYILKDAVTQLNGKINVRSRSGEGTDFSILLPLDNEA